MRCPKCDAENASGQLFCGHCGTRIAATEGEEPYYTWSGFGSTVTVTRRYYWTYYGGLLIVWAGLTAMVFSFYFLTGFEFLLGMGGVLAILAPFLLLVVLRRIRNYQRQKSL